MHKGFGKGPGVKKGFLSYLLNLEVHGLHPKGKGRLTGKALEVTSAKALLL